MALLQISEPGQSKAPHQRRLAVGIDLGTTNSLVATVRSGEPYVINDDQGESMLPSVVRYLAEGRAIVGAQALNASAEDPLNTICSVKRAVTCRTPFTSPFGLKNSTAGSEAKELFKKPMKKTKIRPNILFLIPTSSRSSSSLRLVPFFLPPMPPDINRSNDHAQDNGADEGLMRIAPDEFLLCSDKVADQRQHGHP